MQYSAAYRTSVSSMLLLVQVVQLEGGGQVPIASANGGAFSRDERNTSKEERNRTFGDLQARAAFFFLTCYSSFVPVCITRARVLVQRHCLEGECTDISVLVVYQRGGRGELLVLPAAPKPSLNECTSTYSSSRQQCVLVFCIIVLRSIIVLSVSRCAKIKQEELDVITLATSNTAAGLPPM